MWEQYPDNFIIYNKWCEDEDYQKEIEQRYGWSRVPRLDKLPESGIGDGSSFKGTKLSFDERYLEVIDKHPEEWVQICSNTEINNYSKVIFGIEIE